MRPKSLRHTFVHDPELTHITSLEKIPPTQKRSQERLHDGPRDRRPPTMSSPHVNYEWSVSIVVPLHGESRSPR